MKFVFDINKLGITRSLRGALPVGGKENDQTVREDEAQITTDVSAKPNKK